MERRNAVFSECRRYRYALEITWDDSLPTCTFVMLNPSTADEVQDDPTIRRCKAFAKSWGYGRLLIGNLFALRSTDPKALAKAEDPVGPDNREWLFTLCSQAAAVVCAWGSHKMAQEQLGALRAIMLWQSDVSHLGLTKNGSPKHPLYLAATTQRHRFEV